MSLPRQILPEKTYLLTRRCSQRMFLLRPSKEVNNLFLYCLGYAATRFHIDIIAACVLSNHYHIVATDRYGELPAFMQWLNVMIARGINAMLGRNENMWAGGTTYSAVRLETADSIIDKTLYTLVNPTQAGLVRNSYHWPGVYLSPATIGDRELTIDRPHQLFSGQGNMPEQVTLKLTKPEDWQRMSWSAYQSMIAKAVTAEESRIHNDFEKNNKTFQGRRSILDQSPFTTPITQAPRNELNPRIATRDKTVRKKALKQLRAFQDSYQEAKEAFKQGIRDIVFPYGTYQLRIECGVMCASP